MNKAILKFTVFMLLVFLKLTFIAQRSKILNMYTNCIFNANIIGLFSELIFNNISQVCKHDFNRYHIKKVILLCLQEFIF